MKISGGKDQSWTVPAGAQGAVSRKTKAADKPGAMWFGIAANASRYAGQFDRDAARKKTTHDPVSLGRGVRTQNQRAECIYHHTRIQHHSVGSSGVRKGGIFSELGGDDSLER
jgi:hypothetical protein